ncbi:MAG: hypothetical protein HY513_02150 [Candidatus Aenigmarchaeota archaeon]|nr:hypothetical protein [Candidatus Aenigmarchaeota archaeon]
MKALDVVYNDSGIIGTARYKETEWTDEQMAIHALDYAKYLESQGFRHGGTPELFLGRVAQSGMYAFFCADTLTDVQMFLTKDELSGQLTNAQAYS